MAYRRAFKTDTSFLEKLSMGATGTCAVLKDLTSQGHTPIELERGSMSFKIWKKIKIKRIRVPDILCVDCGKGVECRTKTKLEISMSHSQTDPQRGWDFGLVDSDVVAFIVCEKVGDEPIDWQVSGPIQYVSVKDLRTAHKKGQTKLSKPKGAEEGFEMRIIWPTAITHAPGTIQSIEKNRIKYRRKSDSRMITLRLMRNEQVLAPLVKEQEKVAESQIIASVVPVSLNLSCDKSMSEEQYLELLSSASLSKRYIAAKALAFFPSTVTTKQLIQRLEDANEHIYVRLEAAASLARQDNKRGYDFIEECLMDEYLENRLEAVIVLGEINKSASCKILVGTLLDKEQHTEIRAGAAWALGELSNKNAMSALIESFLAVDEEIRIEAARALGKLARQYSSEILKEFPTAKQHERPGISWAISKAGKFTIKDMLDLLVDEDARAWVSYIVGSQDQDKYIAEIEQLKKKDPEVYFAVTVLWKIMTSWVWDLEEY